MKTTERVDHNPRRRDYGVGDKNELIKKIAELYEEGSSQHEISKKIGIPRGTISRWMLENNIQGRDPGEEGKKRSKKYTYYENFFEIIDTFDKAYILGFILGDGCIYDEKKRKRLSISLALGDAQILRDIAGILNAQEILKVRKTKEENWQDKICLAINSTQMCNDLIRHGIKPRKTGNEPWIKLQNSELQWAFFRGLFDADGCITIFTTAKGAKRQKITISNSLYCCNGAHEFLKEQGIEMSKNPVYLRKGENCHSLEINRKTEVLKIYEKMYQYGDISLDRKKQKFSFLMI